MAKKYYAVREGNKPGIYETWDECKLQIHGYSGAKYKSFGTYSEAENYFNDKTDNVTNLNKENDVPETDAIAYVDGSYDVKTKKFSCGVVFFYDGKKECFSELFYDEELSKMRNVAGEIKGSEIAIRHCLKNKIKSITIYHDYQGIAKWCSGEWKAKKEGTKAYKKFYDEASKKTDIHFVKVKAHSGDEYNEEADSLAKKAFEKSIENNDVFLPISTTSKSVVNKKEKKSVFIDREKIRELILEIGNSKWEIFHASELIKTGKLYRCNISADGENAILDFSYNSDGSTTIDPAGENLEISMEIKTIIFENYKYENNALGKTYSFKNLSAEWSLKLIEYLKTLITKPVVYKKREGNSIYQMYKFSSDMGDTLTVNLYETGTVTLQGKPAYLYSEAISFLSYCNEISVDNIVDTVSNFHNVDIKTEDVKTEIENLLPNSYKNIDEMIIKLLSPSISLRKIKVPLDDYTCYAFPALRALEGYIKYLFSLKNVTVDTGFYRIFSDYELTDEIAAIIDDDNYKKELERLYKYFKDNRHVHFHAEQIVMGTKIIKDKEEADEIVNNVINLIETSYISINGQQ